jgi:adenylate cyclase
MLADFFAELKRRRVFRTAVIYAAAAWGVTEASTTVFEHLKFPEWASMLVVIVFLVGFPISVYLAWVFDITSEGIHRTQPLGIRGWGAMLVSVVMLIGGTGILFWLLYEPGTRLKDQSAVTSEIVALPTNTIAVLPFSSAQGHKETLYFAEGVAETLLAQLSNSSALSVIARDSSFSLRESTLGARDKARLLNAAYLLDGSVQLVGERIRIIARLVDGESGSYLWSETMDGHINQVFDLEDRIAESVVAQLRSISANAEAKQDWRRVTSNVEAYDHYLRAQFALNEQTPEALENAIEDFDRAIALDENFALAYVGRANAKAFLSAVNFSIAVNESTDPIRGDWLDYAYPFKVRASGVELEKLIGPDIERARELAPDLPEAYTASGLLALRMRRFDEAESELKRAIALNPSDTLAHQVLGLLYLEISHYTLALEQLQKAQALDPLSAILHFDLAGGYYYTGQYSRAIAEFETLNRIAPDRYPGLYVRYPYFQSGQYLAYANLALGAIRQLRSGQLSGGSWWEESFVDWALMNSRVYLGDTAAAKELLSKKQSWKIVDGRHDWTEEERNSMGPVGVYSAEEMWASEFRFPWVVHDGSFQDAYDYLTGIIASIPDGLRVSSMAYSFAARYALALGKCDAAKSHFEAASEDLAPEDWPYANMNLDFLYAYVDAIDYAIALRCLGEEETARRLIDGTIDWMDEMEANGYGVSQIPVIRAKAHALRGEPDKAIEYLESYAQLSGPILLGIINDPAFEPIEHDPRFQAVVETIRAKDRVILEQIDRAVDESGLEF